MRGRCHTEWHPETLTRVILVERLCVAAWKLERATLSEMSYRRVTAEGSIVAHQAESRRRVESGLDLRHDYPAAALADLESHAPGIDRLLSVCAALESDLAKGPSAWDRPFQHARLMLLHGRDEREDAAHAGAAGRASAKLLASNQPGGKPLPAEEGETAVAEIRADVARHTERLHGLRARVEDPAVVERRMMEAAMTDETHGAQLRFRYEQQIERSIRSTIKQLMERASHQARARPPAPARSRSRAGAGPSGWPWWVFAPVRDHPGHWWASHQWHPDTETRVATQYPRAGCAGVGFVRRRRVGAGPEASRSQENGPRGPQADGQATPKGPIEALKSILMNAKADSRTQTTPTVRALSGTRASGRRARLPPSRDAPLESLSRLGGSLALPPVRRGRRVRRERGARPRSGPLAAAPSDGSPLFPVGWAWETFFGYNGGAPAPPLVRPARSRSRSDETPTAPAEARDPDRQAVRTEAVRPPRPPPAADARRPARVRAPRGGDVAAEAPPRAGTVPRQTTGTGRASRRTSSRSRCWRGPRSRRRSSSSGRCWTTRSTRIGRSRTS